MSTNRMTALADHRAALTAQCPPAPPAAPDAAALPTHVTRRGDAGPSVLFVYGGVQSGLGGGASTFVQQEALAARGWRFALVDRPGFGQSPSGGRDDMLADAPRVVYLPRDRAHLVEHA